MTVRKLNEVYKCEACGNIVVAVHAGGGDLVCCGSSMELVKPKKEDQGMEKHVPVIEKTETGIKVKVGDIPHPMETDHYIEWIEVIADGKLYRKYLNPGDTTEVEFCIKADSYLVREYCNLHGLWQAEA